MNIDQLKGVIAIDEEGSVSRAAKRLFISQSSLSNSVAVLEREVGFQIFERSNLGMQVTPQGRRLISYARSILSFSDDIMAISNSGNTTCRFRLVAPHSLKVQNVFSKFCLTHKDDTILDISYVSATSEHTVEMIHRNLADFGILCIEREKLSQYEEHCKNRGILLRVHMDANVEVMFAENHPLNHEEDLIGALASYPLVASPDYSDHMYIAQTERILDAHPAEHIGNRRILVADWNSMVDLVARGVGYRLGFLDKDTLGKRGLRSRSLDVHFVYCTVVSEDKRSDPHVMEFEKLLAEEYKNVEAAFIGKHSSY